MEGKEELPEEKKEEKIDLCPEQYEPEPEMDEEKKQRNEDIEQVLNQFNKRGEGSIAVKDFVTIMHALDQNPTEEEIKDYIEKYSRKDDKEPLGVINIRSIFEIIEERLRDPDTEEALRNAFRQIENEEGKLTNQEFIYLMTTQGNPMEEEMVKSYLQYADQDKDGIIEVDSFVSLLMSAKK
eukprot:TRINITY_DN7929_c0_g2_i1.p1 TRINITY_DN7929_c0_g2~~TRINITY_DN7929_c0_g2_i1.p1  ORF type:complete len:182 (-),score=52.86 TRINITY_DN7929_c0_g2_i1:23-568(-)